MVVNCFKMSQGKGRECSEGAFLGGKKRKEACSAFLHMSAETPEEWESERRALMVQTARCRYLTSLD